METKIPFVLHLGGNPWLELKGERLKRASDLISKASRVTTVSKFLQDKIKEHLPKLENIESLPGGLWGIFHTDLAPRPSRFKIKENYKLNKRPTIIMSIGLRDEPVIKNKWAGLEYFLQNAKPLIKNFNVKFICAARGDYNFSKLVLWRNEYNFSFINSHHCHSEVDLWSDLLNGSDLFVHPSFYDCWPRVIAEAMLVGLPVFTFDITGNKEVSNSMFCIKPGNVEYMIEQIGRYLEDEKSRRMFGFSMREEALQSMERHKYDFLRVLLNTFLKEKSK
jgi:glycosyltransferase involved in cell wall biosynthesis